MSKTLMGSNDGIVIQEFCEGRDYLVSDDLAKNFIGQGAASRVDVEPFLIPIQEPAIATETPPEEPSPRPSKALAPPQGKPGRHGKPKTR